MTWTVLEEVALDAVLEDGRLVSRTSARRIAAQLGVDPATAASSLRLLRQRGVLALERQSGPAGRFGLSLYVLASSTGLTVIPPRTDASDMADSCMDSSKVKEADTTEPGEKSHARWKRIRRRCP